MMVAEVLSHVFLFALVSPPLPHGRFVYRLGLEIFILERGVRFPYRLLWKRRYAVFVVGSFRSMSSRLTEGCRMVTSASATSVGRSSRSIKTECWRWQVANRSRRKSRSLTQSQRLSSRRSQRLKRHATDTSTIAHGISPTRRSIRSLCVSTETRRRVERQPEGVSASGTRI